MAKDAGVGVVPLASAGGAARQYWEQMRATPPVLGGQTTSPDTWERLGHDNVQVAARAALDLLDQSMYHQPPQSGP